MALPSCALSVHSSEQLYMPRRICRQMPHGTLKDSEFTGKTHTAKFNGFLGLFLLLLKLHTYCLSGLPLPQRSQSDSALSNNTWQLVAASSPGS